jgi:alkyl hydroperoxide reductase subunit AhpC
VYVLTTIISNKCGDKETPVVTFVTNVFNVGDRFLRRQNLYYELFSRSVDETLRLVQAFQFTDKHGEVCPADWTPGSDTIIPDPKGKIKYFKSHGGSKDGGEL